jgi:surfeit locus 1 family protein
VVLAALFVRLGFWQLDRLEQRRAFNADRRARIEAPAIAFERLRSEREPWLRQSFVDGTPDFANDFAILGRSRNGSPGVYIVTPVRMPGNDTAVLVNRGWVYSPDAASVDLGRWRERRARFSGHTDTIPTRVAPQIKGRGLRGLGAPGVDSLLPYPFYGVYLISHDSAAADAPARLSQPALDEGPHLSYAIQWFFFAAIALVGAGIVGLRRKA